MNFFNIENELTSYCLKQFDDNKFIIWDVECLEQLYNFLGKRLNELEKSRKIKVDNVELELEYNKMNALLDELHEKLENVYKYQEEEVEDSGSSFGFERHSDNDEKPIVLENLRKEDIRYTPPRLEFVSNSVFEKNKNSYDNNDDDTKALINQADLLKNDISRYGGKNYSKKKISKKYKNKKSKKNKKTKK
jgi:hypothetical protein